MWFSIAFWIFLVLTFSQAHGEDLFRWTDNSGRPCYSNVSPSAGVKEYSVDTVFYPAPDRQNSARASIDADVTERTPAKADGSFSDFSEVFLKQRITDRKRSIGHIEALLRKHPDDQVLRKSLFKKKQYLFEDLTRLKTIQR